MRSVPFAAVAPGRERAFAFDSPSGTHRASPVPHDDSYRRIASRFAGTPYPHEVFVGGRAGNVSGHCWAVPVDVSGAAVAQR